MKDCRAGTKRPRRDKTSPTPDLTLFSSESFSCCRMEVLPKDARNIILEYKSGAELLDLLIEYDARPDRGMELCPFDDPDFYPLWDYNNVWTIKELFNHHIFHSDLNAKPGALRSQSLLLSSSF